MAVLLGAPLIREAQADSGEFKDAFAQEIVEVDDTGQAAVRVHHGQYGDGLAFHDVQQFRRGLAGEAAFGVGGHDAGHGQIGLQTVVAGGPAHVSVGEDADEAASFISDDDGPEAAGVQNAQGFGNGSAGPGCGDVGAVHDFFGLEAQALAQGPAGVDF